MGVFSFDTAARLEEDLAVQTAGLPTLERWITAVRDQILAHEDLLAANAFLLRARTVGALSEALRED